MFDGKIIWTIRKVISSTKRRIFSPHVHFQMLEEIVVFMRCEWYQHSDCTRKRCVNQRIVASRYQIGFLKWEIRYFLYKLSLIIYKLYIHIQPFYLTVWKFHDFSITQILREIDFLWICALFEGWNLQHQQNSEPLNVLKWYILTFYNPQYQFHVKSEW